MRRYGSDPTKTKGNPKPKKKGTYNPVLQYRHASIRTVLQTYVHGADVKAYRYVRLHVQKKYIYGVSVLEWGEKHSVPVRRKITYYVTFYATKGKRLHTPACVRMPSEIYTRSNEYLLFSIWQCISDSTVIKIFILFIKHIFTKRTPISQTQFNLWREREHA